MHSPARRRDSSRYDRWAHHADIRHLASTFEVQHEVDAIASNNIMRMRSAEKREPPPGGLQLGSGVSTRTVYSSLAFIILLAGALRFTGIRWGVPTPDIPHYPFHPDEQWVMGVLSYIDVRALHFNPVGAHREGALSFNIWAVTALCLKTLGITHKMPNELTGFGDKDYGIIMIYGRIVTACMDVFSVLLIFVILRVIAKNRIVSLIGALIYAILPFEVIHAHYMRGHVIVNFFMLIVMYFSVLVYEVRNERYERYLYILIGLSWGLATAARYTAGIIVVVPVMMIICRDFFMPQEKKDPGYGKLRASFISRIGHIGVFGCLGLFAGDPYLFLNFKGALRDFSNQITYIPESEFKFANLLDLSRVWVYLRQLIPYGTLPALWIVFYASAIYLLFRKKYYRYTLPLIILIPLYIYPMAKGYSTPIFIRAVLFLFPIFTILSAIAVGDMLARTASKYTVLRTIIFSVLLLATTSSLCYDLAYVKGMHTDDPRIQLYKYFNGLGTRRVVRIGLPLHGHSYFLHKPTLLILGEKRIKLVESENLMRESLRVDYILLAALEPRQYEEVRSTISRLQGSDRYILERTFENPVSFMDIHFDYKNNPHDLKYPYPTLFLLRHVEKN